MISGKKAENPVQTGSRHNLTKTQNLDAFAQALPNSSHFFTVPVPNRSA